MNRLRVALFDVDGVLLDSLTPHLRICEDKSREYGLNLTIPGPAEFKKLVRRGTKISPMEYFFLAVGFPKEYARKANEQYQRVFMTSYAPAPFPGVHETLRMLRDAGLQLGIVTSNVKANVVEALGESASLFAPNCIYSKENMGGMSKSQAITSALKTLQVDPNQAIYIGDQPADWEAAKSAHVSFLGVTYGWGISDTDTEFPVVRKVAEIGPYVTGLASSVTGISAMPSN